MKIEDRLRRERQRADAGKPSVEQELVWATRAIHAAVFEVSRRMAAKRPRLGRRLRRSAGQLLLEVERAVVLPPGAHEVLGPAIKVRHTEDESRVD
jgi:hypothetical protein